MIIMSLNTITNISVTTCLVEIEQYLLMFAFKINNSSTNIVQRTGSFLLSKLN